jgi:hypothetical protein
MTKKEILETITRSEQCAWEEFKLICKQFESIKTREAQFFIEESRARWGTIHSLMLEVQR